MDKLIKNLKRYGLQVDTYQNDVELFVYRPSDVYMSDNVIHKNGIIYNTTTDRIAINGSLRSDVILKIISAITNSKVSKCETKQKVFNYSEVI